MNKKAIVTGVSGQDGSYLSELLLREGYEVYGIKRRTSSDNLFRLHKVLNSSSFKLIDGDITDLSSMISCVDSVRPHLFFNLAAQSQVGTSFSEPMNTFRVVAGGCLNCLEAIRIVDKSIRFYQASSSEQFGDSFSSNCYGKYQNELTPFNPLSPYAVAKVAAHNYTKLYRKSYDMFAATGILFNHDSPRRGDYFVTKKIINFIKKIAQYYFPSRKEAEPLVLGNIETFRSIMHAKDAVEAMYLIITAKEPDDWVVGVEESHSIRFFFQTACLLKGIPFEEVPYICNDPRFVRPMDVPFLKPDCNKIRFGLGWKPKFNFEDVIKDMLLNDV